MLALVLTLSVSPAWALYKIVGPDGQVTYTDRPPSAESAGKVSSFRPGRLVPAADAAAGPALPTALRQLAAKQPVTVYTAEACAACDGARQLLLQRGVPFTERRIVSNEDMRVLETISGGRSLPTLGIGPKLLKGLNEADWHAYLDAAGYPKQSALPAGWKPAPAQPLAEAAKPTAQAASAPSQPVLTPTGAGR